ncbi:MAG: GHMP kinase [Methanomicrobiales archaeon]|nr:GHMP kinase [Methanomicrobiales archaeon]
MARVAVAFSPAHLSGYFRKVSGAEVQTTGSKGAGVVVEEGVQAVVSPGSITSITIHRLSPEGMIQEMYEGSPPLEYAMKRLGVTAHVTTSCRLPIGAGFGCSAAALLATLSALSSLYSLHLSREEISALAHESEVMHQTGLGDVAALQGGGFVCRKGPGIHGEIIRQMSDARLVALSFGPLLTPSVLGSEEAMAQVNTAFPDRCPDDLEDFLSLSRTFAEHSGLITPRVRQALECCDRNGVPASMTMLGEGVFACEDGAREALSPLGTPFLLRISPHGFSPAEEDG